MRNELRPRTPDSTVNSTPLNAHAWTRAHALRSHGYTSTLKSKTPIDLNGVWIAYEVNTDGKGCNKPKPIDQVPFEPARLRPCLRLHLYLHPSSPASASITAPPAPLSPPPLPPSLTSNSYPRPSPRPTH